MRGSVDQSPRTLARFGGVLYLIIIAAGLFGEMFVRGKLVVSGDATATATKILAAQTLWRMGERWPADATATCTPPAALR